MDMCPKKWWFRYREKLDSKRPRRALDVGSAAHNGVELFYTHPDTSIEDHIKTVLSMYDKDLKSFIKLGGYPPDEDEEASDKLLIESMIRRYVEYARERDNFRVISTEEEFNLPVIDPDGNVHEDLRLMGKVDAIALLNGCHFLLEHKTAARIEKDYWWPHLNQIDTYSYAMGRKLGVTFTGAMLNVMLKKMPSIPKLLKNGKAISKTLGNTTERIFIDAVEEFGLKLEDYQDVLESIRTEGNHFVKRQLIYRSARNMREIELKIWHAIQRKLSIQFFPKNKTDKCNYMCGYKDLCIDDQPLIREELYYVREKEHSELEDNGSN